jgi:hypothetical protein
MGGTPFTTMPPISTLAAGDLLQPRDHPQKRGLAAARGADEDVRKSGTSTTVCGIISVPMTRSRTVVRPRNWYFDSAKAAMELTSSMIAVAISVMKVEFQK